MQRVILASTKPLTYGEERLSKTASSLKKVASRKTLPLVLEHDGPEVGSVTDLAYEVKNGIGYLFGSIADFMGKVGSSLQYSGIRSGGEIKMTSVDHVALVDQPRDPVSVFADSKPHANLYRDSADTETPEGKTAEGTKVEPPEKTPAAGTKTETEAAPNQGTEIELTEDTVDQLFELLLKDPKRVAALREMIKGTEPEPKEGPKVEVPEEKPAGQPTRIIIKPREAKEVPVKKAPTPIQRPFKGLL